MNGWIGVDLDGTLAEYHGWKDDGSVGEPIPLMVDRVIKWLDEGKNVKIMTARVSGVDYTGQTKIIQDWCRKHLGTILPVTCSKDYAMIELWDDRAVGVVTNTGLTEREYHA